MGDCLILNKFKPSGAYSITSNGTYNVSKYASASVNVQNPYTETVIWTNSSPQAFFSSLTLDKSTYNGYRFIRVDYYYSIDNPVPLSTVFDLSELVRLEPFEGFGWKTNGKAISAIRSVYIDTNGYLKISECAWNNQIYNGACVPAKIIGLKGSIG